MAETTTPPRLAVCPDCGGILHPARAVRLTSAEVAADEEPGRPRGLLFQCLLCGYQDVRPDEST